MKGQVIDQETKEPLFGANIYASDDRGKPLSPIKGTTTDSKGNFCFETNSKFITISFVGFQKVITTPTQTFTIFELLPQSQSLPQVEIRPKGITLLGFGIALISILKLFKK